MRGAGDIFHGGVLWAEVREAEMEEDEGLGDRLRPLPAWGSRVLLVHTDGGARGDDRHPAYRVRN